MSSGFGGIIEYIKVKWLDEYIETFGIQEYRFGSDLLFMRLANGKNRHIPLRDVRYLLIGKDLYIEDKDDDESNEITVRWNDGHIEKFNSIKEYFGSDFLNMELTNGLSCNIPLRDVRWFSLEKESHQNTI